MQKQRPVVLDLDAPLASLIEAADVTRAHLADQLGVRSQSVRDGDVRLSSLRRAAEALGFELEIRVTAIPGASK